MKAAEAAAYPPMKLNGSRLISLVRRLQDKRKRNSAYVVRNDFTMMAKASARVSGGRELNSALLVPDTSCWISDRGTLWRRTVRSF